MTTSKEKETTITQSEISSECCICGDQGLSFELFRCKVCQFRFQHRYCSNLYPKTESYGVCNWCLSLKDDSVADKTQNSSNSSLACVNCVEDGHESHNHAHALEHNTIDNYKKKGNSIQGSLRDIRRVNMKIQMMKKNDPLRKQKLTNQSPTSDARKRIITSVDGGAVEDSFMVKKSMVEELPNGGGPSGGIMIKQMFGNKVRRRYKLLDEVSSP